MDNMFPFASKDCFGVMIQLIPLLNNASNQRYLMVNLDQHSMNKITLTSNKKAKTGGKTDTSVVARSKRENVKNYYTKTG